MTIFVGEEWITTRTHFVRVAAELYRDADNGIFLLHWRYRHLKGTRIPGLDDEIVPGSVLEICNQVCPEIPATDYDHSCFSFYFTPQK